MEDSSKLEPQLEPMTELGRELAAPSGATPSGKERRDSLLADLDAIAKATEADLQKGVSPPRHRVLQRKLDAVQAAKSILCGIYAVHHSN